MWRRKVTGALWLGLALAVGIPASATEWRPGIWVDENVVELRTTGPNEDPHWSPVWVAVLDDQLYVRLGKRAAGRIESNETHPYVDVRIAGHEFTNVLGEPVPELSEQVANELAEKYWGDFFVRLVPHPLTLRLVPATPTAATGMMP